MKFEVKHACQVMSNHDKFGIELEKSHECGKAAVGYYVSAEGEEFWQCALHQSEHEQALSGSCGDYCATLSKLEKTRINEARRLAMMPLLYDRNGELLRPN
jgi:hypothetical protein